ncbi:lkhA [Symbiodinium sp. CCMP2592]|nr:lkhA [Symbiodinium sp. CCMP2592]
MAGTSEQRLRALLQSARPNWCCKDIAAVEAKLGRIGISSIPELMVALQSKSVNQALETSGQKRFVPATLQALCDAAGVVPRSDCADGKCKANEPRKRRKGRKGSEQVLPGQLSDWSDLSPEGGEGRERSLEMSNEAVPPAYGGKPQEKTANDWKEHLKIATEPSLREELYRRCRQLGVAPPPGATGAELALFLQAVVTWHEMSLSDLIKTARRLGLESFYNETEETLLQRILAKTWEPWSIPVQSFTHLEVAFELLEYFQKLEELTWDDINTLARQSGLPIEPGVRRETLLHRLKLLAIWEQLPTPELESECWRRLQFFDSCYSDFISGHSGMFSFVDLMASDRQYRQELLGQLVKEMHHEALALMVQKQCEADESGADDDFAMSGQDFDEDEPFVCLECGMWARPKGEPAWVDGHRCCDDCALRIYYEEQAKALQRVSDEEEADVLEFLRKWRTCGHGGVSEPAPEPTPRASEETDAELGILEEAFQATVWPPTESDADTGCEERIVCRHLGSRPKDVEPESESYAAAAWSFIAELPTDASEGEDDKLRSPTPACDAELLPEPPAAPAIPAPHVPESDLLCDVLQAEPLRRSAAPATSEPSFAPAPSLQTAPQQDDSSFPRTSPLVAPLRTCFCYASPLRRGLPELDARADWEAIQAEGIDVTVQTATVNAVQEVLLSRTRPDILHISAHCTTLGESPRMVLEGADGSADIVDVHDFANLGWWGGIELLVLLACGSQAVVQRLMNGHGLRRAICCNNIVLDSAAQIFCRTFYTALGAGQALRSSFEAAKASIRHSAMSSGEACKFVLLQLENRDRGPLVPCALERALPQPHEQFEWSQWPRVEDYIGRETVALSLSSLFQRRRAVCLWGHEGSGKTALSMEFCRHFSAPGGRQFSAGAYHVSYDRAVREAGGQSVAALLLPQLLQKLCRSPHHQAHGELDRRAALGSAEKLRQVVRQLDQAGSWLVVIDGLEEGAGDADRELLGELLQTTVNLRLLLTARTPLHGSWASLGFSKVVDFALPPLLSEDSARLLARRARRPLYAGDFQSHGQREDTSEDLQAMDTPLKLSSDLIQKLMLSPLMARVDGHPGQILKAAAEVRMDLPSLLRHPFLEQSSKESIEPADGEASPFFLPAIAESRL